MLHFIYVEPHRVVTSFLNAAASLAKNFNSEILNFCCLNIELAFTFSMNIKPVVLWYFFLIFGEFYSFFEIFLAISIFLKEAVENVEGTAKHNRCSSRRRLLMKVGRGIARSLEWLRPRQTHQLP